MDEKTSNSSQNSTQKTKDGAIRTINIERLEIEII